jgi:hypothetical protein
MEARTHTRGDRLLTGWLVVANARCVQQKRVTETIFRHHSVTLLQVSAPARHRG